MKVLLLSVIACFPCFCRAATEVTKLAGPAVGSVATDFKARNLLTGEKIPLIRRRWPQPGTSISSMMMAA